MSPTSFFQGFWGTAVWTSQVASALAFISKSTSAYPWTFPATHIALDIGGVPRRAGPIADELTRRNGRTID
jgi:hypothetical protein